MQGSTRELRWGLEWTGVEEGTWSLGEYLLPDTAVNVTLQVCIKNLFKAYGLHGICDDVVHLQHDHDQSYMGCRQLPVFYLMNP